MDKKKVIRQCKEQIRRGYNGQISYMEMEGSTMETSAIGTSLMLHFKTNIGQVRDKLDLLMTAHGMKMIDLFGEYEEELVMVAMLLDAINKTFDPSMGTIAANMRGEDEALWGWIKEHSDEGETYMDGVKKMTPKLAKYISKKEEA